MSLPVGPYGFGYQDEDNTDKKLNDVDVVSSYGFLPELRNHNIKFIGHGESFHDKIQTNLSGKKIAINTGKNYAMPSEQNLPSVNYINSVRENGNLNYWWPMYPNNRISLYNRDRKQYNQTYVDSFENKKYKHHCYFMLNPIRKSNGQLQKNSCQVTIQKQFWIRYYISSDYGLEKDTIENINDGTDTDRRPASLST